MSPLLLPINLRNVYSYISTSDRSSLTNRSRFKLPAYCLKFYDNPLTAELRKHKSAKQIWGQVRYVLGRICCLPSRMVSRPDLQHTRLPHQQTFHPGTPEDTNKREHYNAKSASPADDTSRFQVWPAPPTPSYCTCIAGENKEVQVSRRRRIAKNVFIGHVSFKLMPPPVHVCRFTRKGARQPKKRTKQA